MPDAPATLPAASSATQAVVQAPPSPPQAPSADLLWAAAIGAASALFASFVKDRFDRLREQRTRSQSESDVYRQYLAPLCEACERIVWRACEIFVDKRHAFLDTATLPLDFNAYKRVSTLFRVAALIGWIRGMTLELRALPRGKAAFAPPIERQIAAFQSALADGPHVELDRLDKLAGLWGFDLSRMADEPKASLATRFEVEAHSATAGRLKSDPQHLGDLPEAGKLAICRQLADWLAGQTGSTAPGDEALAASAEAAVRGLSYREALLYRDWQDALGDAMIERDPDSVRRFRIVGYERFTELLRSDAPWFQVLARSIDDIDLDEKDSRDFRARQLRALSDAAASILIAVAETGDAALVDDASLAAARRLRGAIEG